MLGATKTLVESRRWKICADNKGLERQFKFKTFRATWVRVNSHNARIVYVQASSRPRRTS